MSKLSNIRCPVCHQRGDWFATDFGPFCSKRCRLIDLGKWFSQEHAITEPLRPEHLDQYAELPAGKQLDDPTGEPENI